MNEFEHNLVLC